MSQNNNDVILEKKINGNEIKIVEYSDKNGDAFYGITVLVPRNRTSYEIMRGAKANIRCSFPLSGDAYDFFMEQMKSAGDKLRFATRTVFKFEADVWADPETGEEITNNRQSYCMPMTEVLYNEKWFDKNAVLSEDAVAAISWMKSDEYVFNQEDLEEEATEETAEETAGLPATNDLPF